MKTITTVAIEYVQAQMHKGLTLDEAAIQFCVNRNADALNLLEEIGSYPNSEPELAAIQRNFKW